MIRSTGHCNPMGTASTMASMVEALGMTLPGFAATPAAGRPLLSLAHVTGRLIVEMVATDLRPARDPDRRAFENAIVRSRPSAARRTRSSTSWRSPGGWASISRSTTSTASGPACRCSST